MPSALTNSQGIATISAVSGDTVSVSKQGYTFSPSSLTLTQNQTAITFTGTPTGSNIPIIGNVPSSYMWIALVILIVILIFGMQK